ncbi:ATP-binding protein [Rhodoferax antarcticus]|uniref:ATP-binding protein n=1 Tax=Rhodoferax antarcticus TaxID=81479 RepID=UPI00222476FB|nr:hypothetical protein [Rhodoferax antarcticus]MCW2314204.1 AAA+ ATPase superfamily predicted ATPase [Rhodoferax antarcticus]
MDITQTPWGFYGRQQELAQLRAILSRQRWFFVQVAGRRRIGKTSLIQQAMQQAGRDLMLYIQIPDSDPPGVLAACNDYLQTFGLSQRVSSLGGLAQLVGSLVKQGFVVALDEFQYFNRKPLFDFCSLLQAEVDQLSAKADSVKGGLIVLGSLHAEVSALLEDRSAPLFNRTTDVLALDHLDIESLLELLGTHADASPERLLFFWNLFEGVPKFYRDAYEQGVLGADRATLLKALFFSSCSCLRGEGASLEELAGRLYEECSRKDVGDFPLSERIKGYWDRAGVEIDLVAVSESTRRIRFGTCKRNASKLLGSVPALRAGAAAFLSHNTAYVSWQVEFCAIAPQISTAIQSELHAAGVISQPLQALLAPLVGRVSSSGGGR